jgi:peptide/nickel transport system substrate-binding protein
MKRLLKISLILSLAIVILAGCGGKKETTSSSSEYKDTLRYLIEDEPTGLFPHDDNSDPSTHLVRNIYNMLVWRSNDEKQEYIGEIAKKWEFIDDVTIRFYLHDNIFFSNGEKMTAEDVKFSYELANLAPKVHFVDQIYEMKIVDDWTIDMITKEPGSDHPGPNAVIMSNITMIRGGSVINKKHYEKVGMAGYKREPLGTGPYMMESWKSGESITLVPNPYYTPVGDHTAAKTPKVIVTWSTDAQNRSVEIETGNVDIITMPDMKDLDRLAGLGLKVLTTISTRITYVAANAKNVPNVKVREALAYALDYEAIAKGVYGDLKYAPLAKGLINSNVWGHIPNWNVKYDPEKAKQLLAEAGYPNGITLKSMSVNDSELVTLGEMCQYYWRQVGINVETTVGTYGVISDAGNRGEYQVWPNQDLWTSADINRPLYTWKTAPDRYALPEPQRSQVIDLINKGYIVLDPKERLEVYRKCQQLILDEWVYFPICERQQAYVTSSKVEGFYPSPMCNPMISMVRVRK